MLLPTLFSLVLLGMALSREVYDLTFSRSSLEVNTVRLTCALLPENVIATGVDFFRNGRPFLLLQSSRIASQGGVAFVVDRSSEGSFTCGRKTSSEWVQSTPPKSIIGG